VINNCARLRPYREQIFEVDELASSAESGRLYGRNILDLVAPRHRLARFDLLRSRHDLQYHGRSTHLFVGVKRRVLSQTHVADVVINIYEETLDSKPFKPGL